jgi:endonuclease YncB( thermonuclease family)
MTNDIIALGSILSAIVCFFLLERKPQPAQQQHPPPPQPQPPRNNTTEQPKFRQFTCKGLTHRVSDGDTIHFTVDNPQIMWLYPNGFSVRVYGINTAEIHAKKGLGYFANRRQNRELKKGFEQKAQAIELLKGCSLIEVEIICPDKYPYRYVGDITIIKNGKKINYSDWMIKNAGAKKYVGHGKKEW